MMKATQQNITGKAIFSWKPQIVNHKSFHLVAWNRYHKAEASLTRLQATIEKSSDNNLYMDGTKTILRVDTQLPWEDLPQSVLGSAKSQTPSKMWHTKCLHHKWYPLEALVIMHEDAKVTYCHQRTPAASMEMIIAILGCVSQEAKTMALQ